MKKFVGIGQFLVFAVSTGTMLSLLTGCGGNGSPISIAGITSGGATRSYVGSETCKTCHPGDYAEVREMGHPYKLNKVVDGTPPTYPSFVPQWTATVNPPAGYTWNDISYVIGGYGWKARFIDKNGYIITGDDVQYNLHAAAEGVPDQEWVAYHASDAPGTKPYNCGACHTTGWVATGPDGPHQDNMPGMYGTFSEPGITCEACHGPGSVHAVTQSAADIDRGDGKTECANCHYRPSRGPVEVSGGFIRHHEQAEELNSAKHFTLKCTDCHDPHKGPHYEDAQPGAIQRQCYECHGAKSTKHPAGPDCMDCHMPKATKSAIKVNAHVGDVHTHIFKINTNPVTADGKDDTGAPAVDGSGNPIPGMFTDDGKLVDSDSFEGSAAVTLDFACYGCHTDVNGVGGGSAPQESLAELSQMAEGMHH